MLPGRPAKVGAAATGALGLSMAMGTVACQPRRSAAPSPPTPFVERFLDHPDRLKVSSAPADDSARSAAPEVRLQWDKTGLRKEWQRNEAGAIRSPPLPFASLVEVDRIEITLSASTPPAGMTLLWGNEATLTREEALRNRRELLLPVRSGTLVVRGAEIYDGAWHEGRGAGRTFLHLLLEPPVRGRVASVDSVRIVTVAEAHRSLPSGRLRAVKAGETRDALAIAAPGLVEYRAAIPAGASLTFGAAALGEPTKIRFSARLAVPGAAGSTLLEDEVHTDGGWRDTRLPLPSTGGRVARLTLAAERVPPGSVMLWSSPAITRARGPEDPPNVILYVLDALRADHLGLYGRAGRTSPFLDELATRATVFRRAYAAATWTKPSVGSIMTSLYPETHGVGGRAYTDALPDGVPTLADLLRGAGYLTAQFTANPLAGALSNLDQGFDEATGPDGLRSGSAGPDRPKVRSEEINARLVPWLTAHARDLFFVYVQAMDTHPPYAAHEADGVGRPRSTADLYDDEVRANDESLRRLYETLVALDLARDTILVFTSDHGEAFGEHGLFGHGNSVYEEEARVPLILLEPGRPPAVMDVPVHHVDLMPTILARCRVPFDAARLEGIDLLAPGASSTPRPLIITRYSYPLDDRVGPGADREWHGVVEGRLKLVVREPSDPRKPAKASLFDVVSDPVEAFDLASGRPGEVDRLERTLAAFRVRQQERRAQFLARHPGPVLMGSAGPTPEIPASLVAELKTLGYLR